jgi:hypothetical protein
MTRARLLLVLLLAAAAPAMAWSRAEDRHVRLRAEAGLPASSARGQVRIYSLPGPFGGGKTSLVARRDGKGRWTVSRVTGSSPPAESHWRLDAREGAALEGLLDNPAALTWTYQPTPGDSVADDYCPDFPLARMEIRWRGRTARLYQTCGPQDPVTRVQALLGGG